MTIPSSISIPSLVSSNMLLRLNASLKNKTGSYYFNITVTDTANNSFVYMMNVTLIDNCTIADFTALPLTYKINRYLNHGPLNSILTQFTSDQSSAECGPFKYLIMNGTTSVNQSIYQMLTVNLTNINFWINQTDLIMVNKSENYSVTGYQGNYTNRNATITVNVTYLLDCSLVYITPLPLDNITYRVNDSSLNV